MKQCTLPKRSVQELEAELVKEPEEEHLMFMLEFLKSPREDDELRVGSTLQIAVDSGSEVHAMPYKLVKHFVEEMKSDTMMLLRGAGREELKYYGRLRVTLKIGKEIVTSDFEVAEVRRPIFSVVSWRSMAGE